MDKRSRERFEQILIDRREELQRRLDAARRHPREAGLLEAKDEGDRAVASAAVEMSEAQRSQSESLLRVITAALQRIKDGSFGECLNCGQEIGLKRL